MGHILCGWDSNPAIKPQPTISSAYKISLDKGSTEILDVTNQLVQLEIHATERGPLLILLEVSGARG